MGEAAGKWSGSPFHRWLWEKVQSRFSEDRSLSQGALASEIGVSGGMLSTWLGGKSLPHRKSVRKLAGCFGVTSESVQMLITRSEQQADETPTVYRAAGLPTHVARALEAAGRELQAALEQDERERGQRLEDLIEDATEKMLESERADANSLANMLIRTFSTSEGITSEQIKASAEMVWEQRRRMIYRRVEELAQRKVAEGGPEKP